VFIDTTSTFIWRTEESSFYRVMARYGFMETPNVVTVVAHCCRELASVEDDVTYYLGSSRVPS
jgi:K+ transporter